MTSERKARIGNGLIVLSGSLLAFADPRFLWLIALMGAGLIFSGATGFCGFARIFDRIDGKGRSKHQS